MTRLRVDREGPPTAGALVPFRFPVFTRTRLPNGVEAIVARSDAAPLVSISVFARAGGRTSPLDQPGIASLHAGLLDEGTGDRDALAIARTIEHLGGVLSTGVDWDIAAVQVGLLAKHVGAGLALAGEVIFDAAFPESEIARLRQQRLGEILRSRDRPAVLASQTFASKVYDGTIYAEPLIGTEASLETITRDDVLDFNRLHMVPSGLTVVVVGDLDPDVMLAEVERRFGGVAMDAARDRARGVPPIAAIEPPAPRRHVIVVDRPGAAQTEFQLGHVSVPRSTPGHSARVLLNAILGGSFTSRLNLNLRERLGLTYGVRSSFVRRTGPGPFVVRAAVDTESTGLAISETLREIVTIRDQGVTVDELEEARKFLIGVFPYTVETVDDLANRIEDLIVFDLESDYYDRHAARLAEVDVEQIAGAATAHLDPERATIVAVGPAETLRPQLEAFGPVEIVTA